MIQKSGLIGAAANVWIPGANSIVVGVSISFPSTVRMVRMGLASRSTLTGEGVCLAFALASRTAYYGAGCYDCYCCGCCFVAHKGH